ncbi:MAG: ankyrin repeat domain-containing protein [Elusimicrobiaceae bacterium]|nr:ankyrin repeat domain-containing protein [Elusimicrobiaceae bacterium]
MIRKIILGLIVLAVIALAVSYRTSLQKERGENLIAQAYYGDLLAVKDEVEKGAPLDFEFYFSDSERDYVHVCFNALHAAASGGNEDVINFLLEQGMNINAQTPDGWTPLFIAARDGQAEAAKLLVFRGAAINLLTNRGASALLMAVTQPYETEKVRENLLVYLLKRGANPNLSAENGFPPLYYAAVTRNVRAVELLLEYGAQLTPDLQKKTLSLLQQKPSAAGKKIAALLRAAQAKK